MNKITYGSFKTSKEQRWEYLIYGNDEQKLEKRIEAIKKHAQHLLLNDLDSIDRITLINGEGHNVGIIPLEETTYQRFYNESSKEEDFIYGRVYEARIALPTQLDTFHYVFRKCDKAENLK